MITFNRMGRYGLLGNQMFQYATLFSVAKENGFDFGIPYANTGDVQFQNLFLPNCFDNLSAKDSSNVSATNFYMEPDFSFDSKLFNVGDDTDICGYFQSEKYFKKYNDQLKKEFTFNNVILQKAKELKNSIAGPAISLHIRLGDYVQQQHNHPVCSLPYYLEASHYFPEYLPLVIFSDDIENAKKYLEPLQGRNKVFFNTNDKYVDMCLMSLCEYHIIANSSFSWWGAWLADSKQTIAPSYWFGPGANVPKYWDDVYCDDWLVL